MSLKENEFYLRQVIALAKDNVASGGRPFACLIVNNHTGEILAKGVNQVAQTGNPTAHAEIVAITEASKILRERNQPVDGQNGEIGEDMKGYNFYILNNPCPMCAAAMGYCGPDKVIYTASRQDYSRYYRDDRRYVDMKAFGQASDDLCSHLNFELYSATTKEAMQVYQLWQEKNY